MKNVPCPDRRFTLVLQPLAARVEASYAKWMKHLVERLGSDAVRSLWGTASKRYDLGFLERILDAGWSPFTPADPPDRQSAPPPTLGDSLGVGQQGMRASEAKSLIEETPPLPQFRARFPLLDVQRDTTAYEALHLYAHGLALLSETLIDSYGKQGELIAYDVLSDGRFAMGKRMGGTVSDFIKQSDEEFDKPGIYSAGLEAERIRISSTECITRVRQCEWARYFREKHPRVGYLIACSTDEAFARGFNEQLRMQRTSTIMEGADVCDFRFYSVGEVSDNQDTGGTA